MAPVTFAIDNANPAAGVTFPTAGLTYFNAVTDLRGTATDNSGVLR